MPAHGGVCQRDGRRSENGSNYRRPPNKFEEAISFKTKSPIENTAQCLAQDWCYNPPKFLPLHDGANAHSILNRCRFCKEETLAESRSLVLDLLMISWGVITSVLVVLVVYRATLSSREDDQIFIDAAEQHHYREQVEIIDRISRLTRPIIALAILSGVLLLASAGVWIYQGFKSF